MTILAQDTFVRANAAGTWGTSSDGKTYTESRGVHTPSIASNKGVLTDPGSGVTAVMTLGTGTAATVEILVRMQADNLASIMGVAGRFVDANNWYAGVLGNTSQTLEIRKDLSSAFSTVGSAAFTYSANTDYWVRFQLIGSALKARVWADGSSEPGIWTISSSDTGISSAGLYGPAANPNAIGNTVKFDNLTITDTQAATTTQTRFIPRALSALIAYWYVSLVVRIKMTVRNTQTLQTRTVMRTQVNKTLSVRFLERVQATKILITRIRMSVQNTR